MTPAAARRRAQGLVVATLLFAGLVGAAMVTYRGGSHLDPLAARYQFLTNYLSDLGATVTYSGRPNALPRSLFAVASIVIGAALAWSAPAWRVWNTRARADAAVDVTTVSAVLAGVGFAAVGLTPQNRWLGLHLALVQIAFSLLLTFIAGLAVVQARNGAPRGLVAANVGLLTLLAADVVLTVRGNGRVDPTAMRIEIAAQKVVVVAAILDVTVQAGALARRLTPTASASDPDGGPAGLPAARRGYGHGEVPPARPLSGAPHE